MMIQKRLRGGADVEMENMGIKAEARCDEGASDD
jgi:hypothetical protein